MRTLLIDNYDSFTYNLYQLISEVYGSEPVVVRNDEARTVRQLRLDRFDNVVISPGPGRPDVARDVGLSAAVIRETGLPLLGVCLGHQAIVVAEGGVVDGAPAARHGYLDRIDHDGAGLFAGLPHQFTAVRYHSLCAAEPLPDALEVTARSSDGVVMGVRHRGRPQWGVQFHPESIASEHGAAILANFARLTAEHAGRRESSTPIVVGAPPARADTAVAPIASTHGGSRPARPAGPLRLEHLVIDRAVDTEAVFLRLYANSATAFWLDSEHVEPGLDRFSFLGDASGPLAEVVRYRVGSGVVRVTRADGEHTVPGRILDYLDRQLRERRIELPDLPFDFTGGYVGYLGYEVKAECGAAAAHRARTPDAQWIFADRLVVVDHVAGRTHLLALTGSDGSAAVQWLRTTAQVLESLPTWANPPDLAIEADTAAVAAALERSRERYLIDIAICQDALRAGESYEICLTDTATVPATAEGLDVYRTLRRCNPAPYAAYLRFDELEIACSSPERFLKIDRHRTVESKPIKGTAPRGATPAEDERLVRELASSPKTRAENLMIVDLLRNDLGRVCEIGSVHVPKLMATETYSTLHQLVSTVRGTLRPEAGVIDCVRACFPGGSMTGAPKLRTMEIIDELETRARGVYSGTIGFLGLGGTADLNIVIRTAVLHEGRWQIGAGGAIVLDSVPEDEYAEMVLKAAATHRAVSAHVDDSGPSRSSTGQS
ncbi:aminodeoxychorismate synthase [Nocardia cyriacigeorgica]|uniref:aminodeoxychorismate synthase n=2 Tax=Nocardia cyriacigeorgica TaxID=135487 RepID=UPI0002D87914|nr:aminodeoxychorismate synthase [Nocardia cyriacigeorgica]AVH24598.1 aminodeoxychorismate synthase [Nocardia cyriacigeorgica]PPJ01913.1 aminodeoxychorismate synthase [Nocardia cyriacigeorgica]TLF57739.1 aminodeoxychorismate synthase [Nocardia cyriacigeorgica]